MLKIKIMKFLTYSDYKIYICNCYIKKHFLKLSGNCINKHQPLAIMGKKVKGRGLSDFLVPDIFSLYFKILFCSILFYL